MATPRTRAYRRAQAARAYARADRLVRTVWRWHPDDPAALERCVRMYSVDRSVVRPPAYDYDHHRPSVRRADLDAADQLADL